MGQKWEKLGKVGGIWGRNGGNWGRFGVSRGRFGGIQKGQIWGSDLGVQKGNRGRFGVNGAD